MFYLFFAIVILLSLFVVWIGSNIYAVFYLTHKAELVYGRLFLALAKKDELLNNLLNEINTKDDECRMVAFEIKTLRKEIESDKDIHIRLKKEDECNEKIVKLLEMLKREGFAAEKLCAIEDVNGVIKREREAYNKVVGVLAKLYKKKVLSLLIRIFHIKKLIPL